MKPTVVCLCGSTRFGNAFAKANLEETLAGRIVLSIGCNMKSDSELFGSMSGEDLKRIKTNLDDLHKRKIDLADEILVLNVGGYIGDSTRSEIEYAKSHGKNIRWLEPIQQPQSAPVPKLVEACEAYFRASDVNHSFRPCTKLHYHGMDERETMRLALAAEKRRHELVERVLEAVRDYFPTCLIVKTNYLQTQIDNLDAFDKECTV